jgi:hypothetical protein
MEKKLKTLLAAVEKELLKKPNRKTLDTLALLAGFQSWESFQKNFNGNTADQP